MVTLCNQNSYIRNKVTFIFPHRNFYAFFRGRPRRRFTGDAFFGDACDFGVAYTPEDCVLIEKNCERRDAELIRLGDVERFRVLTLRLRTCFTPLRLKERFFTALAREGVT